MNFIFSLIIALVSLSFANIDKEKIQWSEDRKLTWADFKGQPQTLQGYVASTNSGISISFSIENKANKVLVDYTISSFFYPYDSWYVKGNVNERVLSHEQTHFDISELFARKLKMKFANLPKNKNFKNIAEKVYRENEQERVAMQDLFDLETDHSRNEKMEYQWEASVQAQLKMYDDWK